MLLFLSPVVIYFLMPTDEARVQKVIRKTVSAIEAEKIEDSLLYISYSYQDEYGLSFVLIKKLLEREFIRYSDMDIKYDNLVIRIDKDKAQADMDVRMIATLAGERAYFIGDNKEPAHITLYLKKEGLSRWLIVKSSGIRIR